MLALAKDYKPYNCPLPVWYRGYEDKPIHVEVKARHKYLDISKIENPSVTDYSLAVSSNGSFFYRMEPRIRRACRILGKGNLAEGWKLYNKWKTEKIDEIVHRLQTRTRDESEHLVSCGHELHLIHRLVSNVMRAKAQPMKTKEVFDLGRELLKCLKQYTKRN